MVVEELYQKGLDANKRADGNNAYNYFLLAAEQGYAPAQHELAICYYDGYGVRSDLSLSYFWEKKAAEQGYAEAEYGMGCCYQNGDGVEYNYLEAIKWFQKAAEKGQPDAQYELGEYYSLHYTDQSMKTAFYWYKKAADQGHIASAYEVAMMYKIGTCTEQDYEKSMRYFKKVVNSNADPFDYPIESSMREIGWLYYNGQGVEKDEYKALLWFKESVEQILDGPQIKHWTEKVKSLILNKTSGGTIWNQLKNYIDEKGNLICKNDL